MMGTRFGKEQAGYRAYRLLQFAFIVTPIVAGADKYFHLLVNWDQYLSPVARHALGSYLHLFMRVIGACEICVGIGMAIRPRIFAYVASAWLISIVINLLLTGVFFDIALRDFVLVLATFALGPLSEQFARKEMPGKKSQNQILSIVKKSDSFASKGGKAL